MDDTFNSFKERIMLGLKNNIPVESRLIMLGEIIYAVGCQDLVPKQARELEDLLALEGAVRNYTDVREQAIFGELIENEKVHQSLPH